MGENNCSWNRRLTMKRETLLAAQAIYQSDSIETCRNETKHIVFFSSDMYGNDDGSIPASYRVLYFIGWKPDPSQVRDILLVEHSTKFHVGFFFNRFFEQKAPAQRGSANVSFKDIDKVLAEKK